MAVAVLLWLAPCATPIRRQPLWYSAGTRLVIRNKLANPVARRLPPAESLADILEHDLDATIQNWMALMEHDEELTCVPLGFEDRPGHLTNLIADLIT